MGFGVLVDLTKCIGCKSCVNACNQHNQLPAERFDFYVNQDARRDAYSPEPPKPFGRSIIYEERSEISADERVVTRSRDQPDLTDNLREPVRKVRGASHRPGMNANSYTVVEYHLVEQPGTAPEWHSVKRQCMHCLQPACNAACPVGALHPTPEGPVVYDAYKCIGCRYCMMACPFAVPAYQWDRVNPYIRKCTFCYDRINSAANPGGHQRETACTQACPTGTLMFGKRESLVSEAKRRQLRWPATYVDKIYGETDAGGTSWIYLSPVPFEELGFPMNIGSKAYPDYTGPVLDLVPMGVTGSGLALAGLYWLYKRKLELAGEVAPPDRKGERRE